MRTLIGGVVGSLAIAASLATAATAQPVCPPEVASARTMLSRARPWKDVEAGRSQAVQAPRNQDTQSPRTGAPQTDWSDLTTKAKASALVTEAEAACAAGNTKTATEKAVAAIELLSK